MPPEQSSPPKRPKQAVRFMQLGEQLRAYYERLQGSPVYDERLQEVIEQLKRADAQDSMPD
jgi:hypothetical protein